MTSRPPRDRSSSPAAGMSGSASCASQNQRPSLPSRLGPSPRGSGPPLPSPAHYRLPRQPLAKGSTRSRRFSEGDRAQAYMVAGEEAPASPRPQRPHPALPLPAAAAPTEGQKDWGHQQGSPASRPAPPSPALRRWRKAVIAINEAQLLHRHAQTLADCKASPGGEPVLLWCWCSLCFHLDISGSQEA